MYQATLSQLSRASRPLFPEAEDIDEDLFAQDDQAATQEQDDPLDFLPNAIQEAIADPPEQVTQPEPEPVSAKKRRRSNAENEVKLDQIWKRLKSDEGPTNEAAAEEPPALVEDTQDAVLEDPGDFVLPERAPNVSCNRLAKAKLDLMFPEKVDLHLLADCQVDEEEEAVCGACLLDLFDGEEDAVEEPEETQPSDVRSLRAARREKKPLPANVTEPVNEYAPTHSEKVGLISSCLHMYHADCIGKWTRTENACCQCKQRYGYICYYEWTGDKSRLVPARKTLQSLSRRNEAIAESEAEAAASDALCHVCHALGDRESLMHCSRQGCDTLAHFYCLNMDQAMPAWRCTDCSITRVPTESPVTVPQPSRRRAHRPVTQSSRVNAARNRLRELHTAAARLHAAIDDYELQELPLPVRRLLPSEKDTVMHKSNVDDLILGQVSVSELSGHSKRKRPAPKAAPAPVRSSLMPSPAKPSSSRPPRPTSQGRSSSGCVRPSAAPKPAVLPCSLDAALAKIAQLSANTESRLVQVPKVKPEDETAGDETPPAPFDPLPAPRAPSGPAPPAKPRGNPVRAVSAPPVAGHDEPKARSLTISKQFIDSARRAPTSDGADAFTLQLGKPAIRAKQTTPRFLLGQYAEAKQSKQGPIRTSGSGKPTPELIAVIESIVETKFPVVKQDLTTLFHGQPMHLLRARTALFTQLAKDSVGVSLFEGAYRSAPKDREKYWRSKASQIAPSLCTHKLLTNGVARQDFLRNVRTS